MEHVAVPPGDPHLVAVERFAVWVGGGAAEGSAEDAAVPVPTPTKLEADLV